MTRTTIGTGVVTMLGVVSSLLAIAQSIVEPSYPVIERTFLNLCEPDAASRQFLERASRMASKEAFYFDWFVYSQDNDCLTATPIAENDKNGTTRFFRVEVPRNGPNTPRSPADDPWNALTFDWVVSDAAAANFDWPVTDGEDSESPVIALEGVALVSAIRDGGYNVIKVEPHVVRTPAELESVACTKKKIATSAWARWFVCLPFITPSLERALSESPGDDEDNAVHVENTRGADVRKPRQVRVRRRGTEEAAAPDAVKELLRAVRDLSDRCRGGSGDPIETAAACDVRGSPEGPYAALDRLGWCFDRSDDWAASENGWHKCGPTSIRWEPTPPGGFSYGEKLQRMFDQLSQRRAAADARRR